MSVVNQKVTSFADVHRLVQSQAYASKRHLYSLDHMFELLEHLGNPQEKLRVIHVAGTSGKTSTAYYVAALLKEAGLRVGLTVSPHAREVNERVQIGLEPLSEAEFCEGFGAFWERLRDTRITPNYFETFVAFAFWEFAARHVDYAVVEVGVGGLLDSTNVFDDPKKICVITDIGYDHTSVLGNTLPEITEHKAGIIKLHNTVFCNRQDNEVMDVIRRRAAQMQADLHVLTGSGLGDDLGFLPLFQQRNFGLSLATAQFLLERDERRHLNGEDIRRAAETNIPARMETVEFGGKTLIMDGAHNAQKLRALRESLRAKYPGQPVAAIVGMSDGRGYRLEEAAKELAQLADHLIVTQFPESGDGHDGSVGSEELAEILRRGGAKSIEVSTGVRQGFERLMARPEKVVVAAGSFYLLNHVRPLIDL